MKKLTKGFLEKPTNHKSLLGMGKPTLFAVLPIAKIKDSIGTARIEYNILTGDWMVTGQKWSPQKMYSMETLSKAIRLAKSINHYNATDSRVTFKKGVISELELVSSDI